MDIIRIVIKGESGYGSYEDAYKERVTITPTSITYEYVPAVESETNVHHKWSYKTDSKAFNELYNKAARIAPRYLNRLDVETVCDIGCTELVYTFEDKHRESAEFFQTSDFFEDLFRVIKKMVPGCEEIPLVLCS